MAKIHLNVVNEYVSAKVVEGIITEKSAVTVEVCVKGKLWDGMAMRIIGACDGVVKEDLIQNGKAEIPWECLIADGQLDIGVAGVDADGVCIYSTWATVGTVARSTAGVRPTPSKPHTLGIVEQVLAAFRSVEDKVKKIWDDYANGRLNGKDGQKGDKGDNYVLTAADKKQIADMAAYDDSKIKDDLTRLNNTGEEPVAAGKVWTANEDGAGWADPQGGGGAAEYKQIEKIVVAETVNSIVVDFDKPLKKLFMCFNAAVAASNNSGVITLYDGANYAAFGYITQFVSTAQKITLFEAVLFPFGVYGTWAIGTTATYPSNNSVVSCGISRYFPILDKISKLTISCTGIAPGTVVTIMGVEKDDI